MSHHQALGHYGRRTATNLLFSRDNLRVFAGFWGGFRVSQPTNYSSRAQLPGGRVRAPVLASAPSSVKVNVEPSSVTSSR